MSIRCKFVCQRMSKFTSSGHEGFLYDYEFYAVHDGSPENEQFWKWTPGGTLKINTVKSDQFVPGKSYYLDITEATE